VIAAPPVDDSAVKEIVAIRSPGVATSEVGAEGATAVTWLVASDVAVTEPSELFAVPVTRRYFVASESVKV
jgi:hypothetical protein